MGELWLRARKRSWKKIYFVAECSFLSYIGRLLIGKDIDSDIYIYLR